MAIFAVLAGAGLAALLLAACAAVGLHRERAFYAAMLIAIASFYPVFAWERMAVDEALWQLPAVGGFVLLALLGYRQGSGFLSAAILAHAVFDLAAWTAGLHAPILWAELCMGFDVVLALAARRFLR
jgi:hypothetical protein